MKPLFTTVILILCCSICGDNARAQSENKTKPGEEASRYVTWSRQYPDVPGAKPRQNISKRLADLVLGKKEQIRLSRPVSVLASGRDRLTILDQGIQSVLELEDNAVKIPHGVKKKGDPYTSLVGVCPLPGGEILFTDSRLNNVFKLSADKRKITVLNEALSFQQPTGVGYSKVSKEIWVVETGAHRIAVLDEQGALIRTIGERGNDTGKFNFPTSICIDKAGDAYVVDAMNFRVQIFDRSGACISAFGRPGDGTGSFARPKGIATDTFGHIYVVDGLFHVVQIFDRDGNFLYTFGKQGRGKEDLWMPNGIFIDDRNQIYVADTYNSRIQVYQLIP